MWRDGWDAEHDRCPSDPRDRTSPDPRGWREAGLAAGERWREAGANVRDTVRTLRRSGYVARNRWARLLVGDRKVGKHLLPDWRYLEGPAEGLQAVDPWKMARNLKKCAATWYVQARLRGDATLTALAVPRLCNERHVCPRCAAMRSRSLAAAARAVLAKLHADAPGPLALVTLTQRDHEKETLLEALGRLRGAWDLMTKARRGERFKFLVSGWYYGIEVTRGAAGRPKIEIRNDEGAVVGRRSSVALGKWWHAHKHVVMRLNPAAVAELGEDAIRAELGAMWRDATAETAAKRGIEGYGWDPQEASGCKGERWNACSVDRDPARWAGKIAILNARGEVTGYRSWFQPIDASDPREVYQACKYPTPVGTLHPVALAEFLAVAHGRRWHQGGGELQSIVKEAELLESQAAASLDDDAPSDGEAVDIGVVIHQCGPRMAPDLDDVAPEHGWPGRHVDEPPAHEWNRWTLSAAADLDAIAAAAAVHGGGVDVSAVTYTGDPADPIEVYEYQLVMPSDWTARELRATSRALAAARERAERARSELPRERAEAKREARENTARLNAERTLAAQLARDRASTPRED